MSNRFLNCLGIGIAAVVGCSMIPSPDKSPPPPTVKEVAGTFIGYMPNGMGYLIKLRLDADGTGFFAWDEEANVSCHRIKKWSLLNHVCNIELEPDQARHDGGLYIKCSSASRKILRCEIGNSLQKWKLDVDLYPEASWQEANKRTDVAIQKLEAKSH